MRLLMIIYITCSSDHLPLTVHIRIKDIKVMMQTNNRRVQKLMWHKITDDDIRQGYTQQVESLMADILTSYTYRGSVLDPEVDLDTYIEHVVKALISAARDTILVSKPSVGTKPFWTPQLTQLSRHEKAVWRRWVAAGRPRDHGNELWTQYKTAKRDFRRSMRQSELQYEQSAIDELVQAEQIDHRFFWYLVNKAAKGSKTRCSRIQPTRAPDGNIVYDPQHINDSWEKYYEELFKPMCKPQYDAANQQMVNDTVAGAKESSMSQHQSS